MARISLISRTIFRLAMEALLSHGDRLLALSRGAFGPGLEHDRGAEKAEPAPKLVHQIALVREVQRAAAVRENGEGRRADGMLRDEKDAALFEMKLFHEPVQFPGGDSPRGRFIHFLNQLE